MKVLFLTPLVFLLSSPLKAEVNNAKHEKCLQAADYEGCMDFGSNQKKSSTSASAKDCSKKICYENEVTQSTDNLGMKIIKGCKFTFVIIIFRLFDIFSFSRLEICDIKIYRITKRE